MPTFRYIEESHEYWADYPDGHSEKYISVTGLIDYHGLINEYSKQRDAALRGSLAHLAAQYIFENRLDDNSVDEAIAGYCESLRAWIRITGFVAEACEVRIFNEHLKLAGTYDVKGYMPDGTRYLLDLKTGIACRWHAWQTAGYLVLEGGYRHRGSLYLRRSGRIANFTAHEGQADEANFISMLNVYRLKEIAK